MQELTDEQMTALLWQNARIEYKFHEAQELIYESFQAQEFESSEVVLLCSRRFGKSYYAVIYSVIKCLQNPHFKACVIAPSMDSARKIIHPILQDVLADAPKGIVKHTTSRYELNFENGSSLTIAGADSAGNSIRGRGFDLCVLEESGQWSSDNYLYNLNSVIRPTLLHSKEKVKLIHCTTPSARQIDHPLHTVTLVKCPILRFTIHDNPLLSKEQIEQECNEQGGEDSFSWRVEYLCEITRNDENKTKIGVLRLREDCRNEEEQRLQE